GAAGGMGFAARGFFSATLKPGIELIMQQADMSRRLERTDLVITGEGRLDGQSLGGKTPIGVARAARKAGKPVVLLTGSLGDGWEACYTEGVTAAFALADGPTSLNDAVARTATLLEARCESLIRFWRAAGS
ncbi:MAG: glycerate kinase, partial [Pseudomonadota bacterium]